MAGPKASKKKKQKQPQKHGVDFKKIKRKVGRKLPPPKNSTSTEIKSKAIILPEQSMAIEKTGLATSRKGLSLEDLLRQTSHHNSKVRRGAITGIREILITKRPAELKTIRFALVEKLSQRIGDDDHLVREALYQLLKLVIFPNYKEDIPGNVISPMMRYIFHAMNHLSIEVRLMAFKFLDLFVHNDSSNFHRDAEKILQSYEDIMRSDLFSNPSKNKSKNVLLGLIRCLSIPSQKRCEDDLLETKIAVPKYLHAYLRNSPKDSREFSLINGKLKDLMPILITRLRELLPSRRPMNSMVTQNFDTELLLLKSINLSMKFFSNELHNELKRNQVKKEELMARPDIKIWDRTVSPVLLKLLEEFPLYSTDQLSDLNEEKHSLLDAEIAEIFFNFQEWSDLSAAVTNKFLPYIEMLMFEQTKEGRRGHAKIREKHLISLFPYIPKLLSQKVTDEWKCSLLQALTQTFLDCDVDSELKHACISIIVKMTIDGSGAQLDPRNPINLEYQIRWARELPSVLIALDNKYPLRSKRLLRLINLLGGCAPVDPLMLEEFEKLKSPFEAFFSTRDGEGNIHYGPFVRLPRDCQELAMAILAKFASVDFPLVKALTRCCLCDDLDPDMLFSIVEDSGITRNMHIAYRLSFYVTVLSCLKVVPENVPIYSEQWSKSSQGVLHKASKIVCKELSMMGDAHVLLQLVERIIVAELKLKPVIDNARALLYVIWTLDCAPTKLSKESIDGLSDSIPFYLLDYVRQTSLGDDATVDSIVALEKHRDFYLYPCYYLFIRSHELLHRVLNAFGLLVDDSSMAISIMEVLNLMRSNPAMQLLLSRFQPEINSILQKESNQQASQENLMSLVEKQ